jgi:acetylornithine deacetylase/succinyl-diaminopimelate desuccinylase-like protein
MGLTTELHETPKHPVVIARNAQVPGRRTVLIYGHYDVQPVDPLNLWTSDPFNRKSATAGSGRAVPPTTRAR